MGRKQIYKSDTERQRACRERKRQLDVKEPAPWILRGVPEEIRDRVTRSADERKRRGETRSNVGHVVAEYLDLALQRDVGGKPTDFTRLLKLEEAVFQLLLDIRCGRNSATGVELERQVEDIHYEIIEILAASSEV